MTDQQGQPRLDLEWIDHVASGLRWLHANATTNGTGTEEEDDDYDSNMWLLILPRITGLISLLAAVCVALEAWKDIRAGRHHDGRATLTTTAKNVSTITHIQLFYQLPLFCYGLSFALGTTTVPKGQAWGAIGNIQTCSFQGFLTQFGVTGAVAWDATLCAAYILLVRYKQSEVQIQSYMKFCHMIIWPSLLVVSFYPLTQQMYNRNGTICWLNSYPSSCQGDECIRGERGKVWQSAISLVVMLHLLYSTAVMICLYCAIRGLENRATMHDNTRPSRSSSGCRDGTESLTSHPSISISNSRRHSRAVGVQGILYASGMVLTSLPTPVYIVLWNTAGIWNNAFSIFATSMVGLVGYVNFVIFFRKRSVARCHTRYAKLLRRGHGWLFDYDWYGLICRCQACLRKEQELPMVTTTPSATPTQKPSPKPRRSHSACPQPLPPVMENAVLEPETKGAPPAKAREPWMGFLIQVKDQSSKMSQWISELGASAASSVDSDSSGLFVRSKDCNASRDRSPTRPVRVKSELDVETLPANLDHRPPSLPKRKETEIDDTEESIGPSTRTAKTEPPTMPVRLVSEVEATNYNDLAVERCPKKPERYISDVENFSEEFRPVYDTEEVQNINEVTATHDVEREQPPNKPDRYISDVELSSEELRPGFDIEVPSALPVVCISEIDMSESEGSDRHQRHPPMASFHQQSLPILPSRFESESEMHSGKGEFRQRQKQLRGPPTLPLRHSSEMDSSDGSTSLGDSNQQRQQRQEQSTSPARPLRFPSEVEDSHNRNSSFMFPSLDAITEHSADTMLIPPRRYVSEVELDLEASFATAGDGHL